ncbi:uncharacterized protein PV09_06515 [Verruconis gallopava]|uniref:GRAM domain-containing protein n=1 Tax=Verruconis gallopava TaxID=253628 RepID=A0A0D2AS83_9PEZI|nr:uncharacterized protein PV09_06515 [Verruconis gallopava]KIW02009.1 hypothetical protein PV09_06515 [Verruconis gallopava]
MSINWVMLDDNGGGFTPLPGEQRLYTSPSRTALSIQSVNKFPGKQPFTLQSSAGTAYLTNRRLVYLPSVSTPALQSFTAPILNLHDTHVAAPFFGPNVWTGIVQAVPGGNIPPEHPAVELKLTFKDGGAFDFHTTFERIKERLHQAVEVARESGQLVGDGSESNAGRGGGALDAVNLDSVHLDELPAYDAATAPRDMLDNLQSPPPLPTVNGAPQAPGQCGPQESFSPPVEPPPGYETVQNQSVADELERRLRDSASR